MAAQANLCLDWSETPEDTFSHGEAHIVTLFRLISTFCFGCPIFFFLYFYLQALIEMSVTVTVTDSPGVIVIVVELGLKSVYIVWAVVMSPAARVC